MRTPTSITAKQNSGEIEIVFRLKVEENPFASRTLPSLVDPFPSLFSVTILSVDRYSLSHLPGFHNWRPDGVADMPSGGEATG